jgi:hypothetical protein
VEAKIDRGTIEELKLILEVIMYLGMTGLGSSEMEEQRNEDSRRMERLEVAEKTEDYS